jgi:hypothetical protein
MRPDTVCRGEKAEPHPSPDSVTVDGWRVVDRYAAAGIESAAATKPKCFSCKSKL